MSENPIQRLPWVSVSIGAGPEEEHVTVDLNYHDMTTAEALKASRQMGYVMRTIEQWNDYLRKIVRNSTDRMADQLAYDEKRKGY